MINKNITLIEALDWAKGREIKADDRSYFPNNKESVEFTDGSKIEIEYERGYAYSSWTYESGHMKITLIVKE